MSSRADPFFAAVLAQQSIINLPNPYVRDGPGLVYVVHRVRKRIYDLRRAGQISRTTYLRQMQIKAGHTNCFSRRRSQYKRYNSSHVILWGCHFYTYECMLLECLVHGSLPPVIREDCGCSVNHREFVDYNAAGGVHGGLSVDQGMAGADGRAGGLHEIDGNWVSCKLEHKNRNVLRPLLRRPSVYRVSIYVLVFGVAPSPLQSQSQRINQHGKLVKDKIHAFRGSAEWKSSVMRLPTTQNELGNKSANMD
ncbi:hypothetical protein C8F04DRAFT_1199104 [Mycena alexandri]|uniref:Uncharacterized protein n=1 Tax=Mycena alexandri TaxID=1745969 RepID=A0AAD6WMT7_9AGAR|nr:hypothetical protein C8F04DRAFT_1199104 [Mycena alexandri]